MGYSWYGLLRKTPASAPAPGLVDHCEQAKFSPALVICPVPIVAWAFKKRPVMEPVSDDATAAAESEGGGPLSRLLRRREKRVSAYGRP